MSASIKYRRKVSVWSLVQFTQRWFISIDIYYLLSQQFSPLPVFPLRWAPHAPVPSWSFLPIGSPRDNNQEDKPTTGGLGSKKPCKLQRPEFMCPWEHRTPTVQLIPAVQLIGRCSAAWLCAKPTPFPPTPPPQAWVSWVESDGFASNSLEGPSGSDVLWSVKCG